MALSASRVVLVGAAKFGASPVGPIILPNLVMGITRTEPLKQLGNEIGVANQSDKNLISSHYFGEILRGSLSNGVGGTFVSNRQGNNI